MFKSAFQNILFLIIVKKTHHSCYAFISYYDWVEFRFIFLILLRDVDRWNYLNFQWSSSVIWLIYDTQYKFLHSQFCFDWFEKFTHHIFLLLCKCFTARIGFVYFTDVYFWMLCGSQCPGSKVLGNIPGIKVINKIIGNEKVDQNRNTDRR